MKENINMKNNKISPEDFDLGEGVKCPNCGSYNTYQWDTDECDFSFDGTGHYYTKHNCKDCDKRFGLNTKFKYQITEQYTSK